MHFKKLLAITLLIGLLAISAVSASEIDIEQTPPSQSTDDHIIFGDMGYNSYDDLNGNLTGDINENLVFDDDAILTSSQEEFPEGLFDENMSSIENSPVLEKNTDSTKNESPLYGIVDIGSNTMELDIYKIKNSGKPKSVFSLSEKSVTAIYVENNNLTKKGIDELVSVLNDFNDVMDLVNVKTKYVFATAILRKIDNTEDVIATVKKKVGLDIHLLSGEKEANTSFNAVKDTDLTTDKGIVIDLGVVKKQLTDAAK